MANEHRGGWLLLAALLFLAAVNSYCGTELALTHGSRLIVFFAAWLTLICSFMAGLVMRQLLQEWKHGGW